jgi:hypothetical protein
MAVQVKQAVRVAGPLERAISQQSAEWLEANAPTIYDALCQELSAGRTVEDVRSTLRRMFGDELRDAFVQRIVQAADYLRS